MSLYALDISWAGTEDERRYLRWELLACEQVQGVFLSAREGVLLVLFSGDPTGFAEWTETLDPAAGVAARSSEVWQ